MALQPTLTLKPHPIGLLGLFVLGLGLSAGCSSMQVPTFKPPGLLQSPADGSPYVPIGSHVQMAGNASADVYQKVRQAKRENAIVLQIIGDAEPIRVLPLPPGQRSVFVSSLMQQTGVIDKFGSVKATLYRASSDSIGGIRMNVAMNKAGDGILPESDYALQAGDRLRVQQREINAITTLTSMLGL